MRRVIDAHVHLSERHDDALIGFAKANHLKYTLDGLLRSMKKHGVAHGLLLSPPLEDGSPLPNEAVLRICKRSGGVLSPAVTVEPTQEAVEAAVEFADNNRKDVKAFKVRLGYVKARADNPVFEGLYEYAESEDLPVLFHTGDTATSTGDLSSSHPLSLDGVANANEELTMVLCHFGNPWFEDVAEITYKHPNVYTDVSGLTTGGGAYPAQYADWLTSKISSAIYFAGGAEKILFGTDYPVTGYPDALDLVKRLKIEESDKEMILWRNAKKVFGF